MSPVSFAAGSRFLSLIGGHDDRRSTTGTRTCRRPRRRPSATRPTCPESADWWDAGYLIVWGTNLPITRTPDAHFMTEARYRGQKVVVVSPGLLRPRQVRRRLAARPARHRRRAGDGDGPRDAQGVLGRPRRARASADYGKRFTDLPLLVSLDERDGAHVPGRFLMAADIGDDERERRLEAGAARRARRASRPCRTARSASATATQGKGRWNLRLGDLDPVLTLHGRHDEAVEVALPRFDVGDGPGRRDDAPRRARDPRRRPARDDGARPDARHLRRRRATGCPGEWPEGYDDASQPVHAGVAGGDHDRRPAARGQGRARVRAQRGGQRRALDDLHGRGHQPLVPLRRDVPLVHRAAAAVRLRRHQRRRLGALRRARRRSARSAGWQTLAVRASTGAARRGRRRARRGSTRTPSSGATTGCGRSASRRRSGRGLFAGQTAIDAHAKAVRMGWMPSFPTFDRNPLDLADEARGRGRRPRRARRVRAQGRPPGLRGRRPERAVELPARVLRLALEPARLVGQGPGVLPAPPARRRPTTGRSPSRCPPGERPSSVRWREEIPRGKLDLLVNVDFRMTTTGLYSDVVLPAATWYEKYDLSMTDMHPFVHSFNQAVPPPWEARTDWDAFGAIARAFSRAGRRAPRRPPRRRRDAGPARHARRASPSRAARCADWRAGECEPVPGRTMPNLTVVERDYGAVAEQWAALGPLAEQLGATVKSASWIPDREVEALAARNGRVRGGVADGRPSLERAEQAAEAMLALSGVTNGRLAVAGFRSLEERCGVPLADLAEARGGDADHLPGRAGAAAAGDHLAGVVGDRRGGPRATPRSRSTSSATSRGTRCRAACTSTSITRGCSSWARGCRRTGRRSTTG